MARGLDEHRARVDAVNALGRTLVRRSGSRCELCEASGVPLRPTEVTPTPEEPNIDEALFLCDACRAAVDGGALTDHRWRCLEIAVWSEVRPVQVTAVRLARRLSDDGVEWAIDLLSGLYLDPDIEARIETR
jgi:protein PhnA